MHAAALRYLEKVARAGSIRQAAERLNVAASAINRQILKLEDEFGVQLFQRLPRGLRLTPAGDLAVRHARATLHDFERLRGQISELKGVKSGVVRIACLDSLLAHVLPEVITAFNRRHPAVTFSSRAAPMAGSCISSPMATSISVSPSTSSDTRISRFRRTSPCRSWR